MEKGGMCLWWSGIGLGVVSVVLLLGAVSSTWAVLESEDVVYQKKWTGDYDTMVEKRIIRVLMPYSKTYFF